MVTCDGGAWPRGRRQRHKRLRRELRDRPYLLTPPQPPTPIYSGQPGLPHAPLSDERRYPVRTKRLTGLEAHDSGVLRGASVVVPEAGAGTLRHDLWGPTGSFYAIAFNGSSGCTSNAPRRDESVVENG